MLNKNVVFSKERIFERVWGLDSESQLETVTESIKNIRKKIRALDKETSYIKTLYGLGYKWDVTYEKDKTIKRDFYLLVVKIFLSTIVSSLITYLCLLLFIFMFTNNNTIKPTNYFVKYLDLIEKRLKKTQHQF